MNIMTMGACTDDGIVFFLPSMEVNGLFMVDLSKDNQAVFIGDFPDCKRENAWQIVKAFYYDGNVYFFSHYSFEMWIMNKQERILKHYTYLDENTGFIDIVIPINNKVWVVSRSPLEILCLDLSTKKVEKIHWDTKSELRNNVCTASSVWKNRIYLCTRLEADVYMGVIDCSKNSVAFYRLNELFIAKNITAGNDRVFVSGISCDGNFVLLEYDLERISLLTCHHLKTIKMNKNTGIDYREMVVQNKKILFLPGTIGEFMIYDINDVSERQMEGLEMPALMGQTLYFLDIQRIGSTMYLFPGAFNKLVKLNLDTLHSDVIKVEANKKEYCKLVSKKTEQIYRETVNVNLDWFLSWVGRK